VLYTIFLLGLALVLISVRSMVNLADKEEAEPGDFYRELEATLLQSRDEEPVIMEDRVNDVSITGMENCDEEDASADAAEFVKKPEEVGGGETKETRDEEEKSVGIPREEEIRQLHQQVYSLSDLGKNGEAIARQLKLGKGEVELILGLRR